MATVETVRGPVDVNQLGPTLMHGRHRDRRADHGPHQRGRAWALLWLLMAALWLLAANTGADATSALIRVAPSGMSWLTSIQHWAASAAGGDGLLIAVVLAGTSMAIGIAVACNWHARLFLLAAILLNLAYWVIGQGLGGIFQGGATDPNAGPLFVLFACALYVLVPVADV